MLNQPREIPLKVIGDLWKQNHPDSSHTEWNKFVKGITSGVSEGIEGTLKYIKNTVTGTQDNRT